MARKSPSLLLGLAATALFSVPQLQAQDDDFSLGGLLADTLADVAASIDRARAPARELTADIFRARQDFWSCNRRCPDAEAREQAFALALILATCAAQFAPYQLCRDKYEYAGRSPVIDMRSDDLLTVYRGWLMMADGKGTRTNVHENAARRATAEKRLRHDVACYGEPAVLANVKSAYDARLPDSLDWIDCSRFEYPESEKLTPRTWMNGFDAVAVHLLRRGPQPGADPALECLAARNTFRKQVAPEAIGTVVEPVFKEWESTTPRFPAKALEAGISGGRKLRVTVHRLGVVRPMEWTVVGGEPTPEYFLDSVRGNPRWSFDGKVVDGRPAEATDYELLVRYDAERRRVSMQFGRALQR
jgi:hypothetical protein